jgi:hypothetical protein
MRRILNRGGSMEIWCIRITFAMKRGRGAPDLR